MRWPCCLHAFGTEVELRLWPDGTGDGAAAALGRAEQFLRGAEARLSRFLPESDIARVNRAAGSPVHVSRLTLDIVGAALAAAEATGGLFDPTLHAALVAAGYDGSFEQISGCNQGRPQPVGRAGAGFREVYVGSARCM